MFAVVQLRHKTCPVHVDLKHRSLHYHPLSEKPNIDKHFKDRNEHVTSNRNGLNILKVSFNVASHLIIFRKRFPLTFCAWQNIVCDFISLVTQIRVQYFWTLYALKGKPHVVTKMSFHCYCPMEYHFCFSCKAACFCNRELLTDWILLS